MPSVFRTLFSVISSGIPEYKDVKIDSVGDSNEDTIAWRKTYDENVGESAVDCQNGVCTIASREKARKEPSMWEQLEMEESSDRLEDKREASNVSSNSDLQEQNISEEQQKQALQELSKLGWTETVAQRALEVTRYDVTAAAELLDAESEEIAMVERLVALDWDEGAAMQCVREAKGNEPAALEMLQEEEARLSTEFDQSVQEMCEAGWEEIAARTALRMQYALQHRRSLGFNDTFSRNELDTIRFSLHPSLHRLVPPSAPKKAATEKALNVTEATASPPSKENSVANSVTPVKSKKESVNKNAPPVRKEEVVLEGTMANFQSLVLDATVPVVVDVYADWCGPCRQLTPMLEEAAVKANGMFRLVKINVDKERALVNCLQVNAFPTMFTVAQGQFVDKVVGGLPPPQLQSYLVRAVTGYGDRVQSKDVSDAMLKELSQRVQSTVGLASITMKKKSLLNQLVEEAMQLPEAFLSIEQGGNKVKFEVADGIRLVMTYLENARREIRNVSRTTLSTQNKYFQASVSPNTAAMKLLEIAGFRPVHDSSTSNAAEQLSTSPSKLALIHKNSAILSLILQKIEDCINAKKFSSMLQTPSTPLPSKASASTTPPVVTHVKSSSGETSTISASSTSTPTKKRHSITCTVTAKDLLKQFCSKELVKLPPVPASTSLRTVLQRLRTTSGRSAGSSTKAVEGLLTSGRLQVTYPSPKRILKGVSLLDKPIRDLLGSSDASSETIPLSLSILSDQEIPTKSRRNAASRSNAQAPPSKSSPPKAAKSIGKTHTMHSMGLFPRGDERNGNEYFNGDSTVMEAKVSHGKSVRDLPKTGNSMINNDEDEDDEDDDYEGDELQ